MAESAPSSTAGTAAGTTTSTGDAPGAGIEAVAAQLAELGAAMVRHLSGGSGMSLTAVSTLARLERDGPLRLTALAAAEGVTQPAMTQLVQRLEQQGLAGRVGDPTDGRASLVTVTDAGRTLLTERRATRNARLAGLLAALPEAEQRTLVATLSTALPLLRGVFDDTAQ